MDILAQRGRDVRAWCVISFPYWEEMTEIFRREEKHTGGGCLLTDMEAEQNAPQFPNVHTW